MVETLQKIAIRWKKTLIPTKYLTGVNLVSTIIHQTYLSWSERGWPMPRPQVQISKYLSDCNKYTGMNLQLSKTKHLPVITQTFILIYKNVNNILILILMLPYHILTDTHVNVSFSRYIGISKIHGMRRFQNILRKGIDWRT